MKRKTTDEFIEDAKKVHGDKYDYSKVRYINAKTKVCIICPIHGEFWQIPNQHVILKQGCPKCGHEINDEARRKSTNKFIEEAKKVHGDKYDYSNTVYGKNNKDKVKIICPIHGEFRQAPINHIFLKQGCPFCAKVSFISKRTKKTEQFIEEAKKVHGDKYDYSKVKYENWNTKICIICPKHGEFWITPSSHLQGIGCRICSSNNKSLTTNEFIEKAKKIHGDYYDYSRVVYNNTYSEVEIICPKHGSFFQKPFNHLQGCGCTKCGVKNSSFENEISEYITNVLNVEVIRNERTILDGKEIDIFIPKYNVGIELNGIRWHSEEFNKGKKYHLEKLEKCSEKGVKLIQIFEDEFIYHKDIVFNKISYLLKHNYSAKKISGRNVIIKLIAKKESNDFLEKYHIQGKSNSSINLGAFFNDVLVSVMTFTNHGNGKFELTRFATHSDYLCRGVCGKFLSFFKKNYKWKVIKTFADRRWTLDKDNNLYTKLGFKLVKILPPDYRYVVNKKRVHKFNFRKQILHKKYNLPLDKTESEMAKMIQAKRIWDCGLFKYEMENDYYQ